MKEVMNIKVWYTRYIRKGDNSFVKTIQRYEGSPSGLEMQEQADVLKFEVLDE